MNSKLGRWRQIIDPRMTGRYRQETERHMCTRHAFYCWLLKELRQDGGGVLVLVA